MQGTRRCGPLLPSSESVGAGLFRPPLGDTVKMRGRLHPSAGKASWVAEPCAASVTFFSSVRGSGTDQDPGGLLSPGCGRGQSAAPCQLLLQLVRLFVQITAEESEDEPLAREERADARLSERDAAGESNEGAVTEETEGNEQRDGEEAEQPDQTVTKPRGTERRFLISPSLCARRSFVLPDKCFLSLAPGLC